MSMTDQEAEYWRNTMSNKLNRIKTRFEEHKNDDKGSTVAMGWWIDDVGYLLSFLDDIMGSIDSDSFHCLAHPHKNRVEEAMCSAKFQIANRKEYDGLRIGRCCHKCLKEKPLCTCDKEQS